MIADENSINDALIGNTHTAQAITRLPALWIASLSAKMPAPIPPVSPPAANAPSAKP